MLRPIHRLTVLIALYTGGVGAAHAGCTSELFDFNDGTLQGWSNFGSYGASNSSGRLLISGDAGGCSFNGVEMLFDGGDSFSISYDWTSNADGPYYSNHRYSLQDADTGTELDGANPHYGFGGDPGPFASGSYSGTVTDEIEGITTLRVRLGLHDCHGSDHGQINTLDNISIEICKEDVDEDGFKESEGDCDDFDADIYPGAAEHCDGIDNDCDGTVDEDDAIDASTWYADDDGDGFGDADTAVVTCDPPSGFVSDGSDCNDDEALAWPGAPEVCDEVDNNCDGTTDEDEAIDASTWYADDDGDGFGDRDAAATSCLVPAGHVADDSDCDDESAETWPGAIEYCDEIDNDCDGTTDETDAADASTWYRDHDGDGFGDAGTTTAACTLPTGFVSDSSDCDDAEDDHHPGATETCDEIDNDCDGAVDEGDAIDAPTWYADDDGDGFGDAASTIAVCSVPSGYVSDDSDCNDEHADTWPGATEVCDERDNDCDGTVDEDDALGASTWFADDDDDGFGDAASTTLSCEMPAGYVSDATDCDDDDDDNHPGATEVCDDADNDCDGSVDEDDAADATTWYADADADGFGDPDAATASCSAPEGHSADGTDCDDAEAAVFPGAVETCDAVDNDCDGAVDEDDATDASTWYIDHDGDGHGSDDYTWVSCDAPAGYIADTSDCDDRVSTTHPDADEYCDEVDNDCDGDIDEEALDTLEFFADADADGFGDAESAVWACSAPEGHVEDDSDCDDADPSAYPGAPGWTADCEPIVDTPEDTGDLGDTGDTGEMGDTGDTGEAPMDPVDTGPTDTGDGPGDEPGEDTGDDPDAGPADTGGSDKGCSCASAQPDTRAPWLLILGLIGLARTRRASPTTRAR